MVYIHNANLYTTTGKLDNGAILISSETITAIGVEGDVHYPSNTQIIDAKGQNLVPGFIDLQINGAFGMDFTTNPETIWQVGERLICFGVTSFLPTIVSSPLETVLRAQAILRKGPPNNYRGSRVIGLHLEGPYLSPEKHGAHDPAYLHLPEVGVYDHWSPATFVRMVTIAPELPGAIKAIETMVKNGVAVSAGHSIADLSQAQASFEAGIRYGTHLFNAMSPLNHREPGLVGALLTDKRIICGMIADGVHLDPVIVNLAWKILGPHRSNLVTDAISAMGMPPGEYLLAGRNVQVDDTSARQKDGTLAGSLLSLDQALRNLITFTGCSLADAIPTITQVPAHLLQLDTSLGNIAVGAKADLVLLNSELQVTGVWLSGHQLLHTPA